MRVIDVLRCRHGGSMITPYVLPKKHAKVGPRDIVDLRLGCPSPACEMPDFSINSRNCRSAVADHVD